MNCSQYRRAPLPVVQTCVKPRGTTLARRAKAPLLCLLLVVMLLPTFKTPAQDSAQRRDEFEQQLEKLSNDEVNDKKTGSCALQLRDYKPALEVAEQHQGPDREWAGKCLYHVGEYYSGARNFRMAEYMLRRAANVFGKDPALYPKGYAASLQELGHVYDELGDLSRAEPLYEQALGISEQAFGADSIQVAHLLNQLGMVYQAKADYQLSALMLERALVMGRKVYAPDDPHIATLLSNIASAYESLGDLPKAEALLKEAIAAVDKPTGNPQKAAESVQLATFLNNLGELYQAQRDSRATPLLERALAMREKLHGPDHSDVAVTLNNLALVDWQENNLKQAEVRLLRAVAINQKAVDQGHESVSTPIVNLAWLWIARGEKKRAVDILTEAQNNNEHHLPLMLATGSEAQKRLYMESIAEGTSGIVSLHLKSAPEYPQAARLALTTLFRRKGRVLDVMSGQVGLLMNQQDPASKELLKNWVATKALLSDLEVENAGGDDAQRKARIESLRTQVEALEKKLSERATALGVDLSSVSIEAVQAAIPANAVLVEMVKYRPVTVTSMGTRWDAPQYAAYVLKHTGAPSGIDLGDAAKIEQDVDLLRTALRSPNDALATYDALARKVDETVMRPIRKVLGNNRQILISPDGAFNFVPFAALKDEQNHYLAENYTFTYLTSGRDLLRLRDRLPSKQGAVVIANPLFDLSAKQSPPPAQAVQSSVVRSASSSSFRPLEGTAEEADDLSKILPNSRVLTGAQATESALKEVKAPSILHIATHGFFHSEPPRIAPAKSGAPKAGAAFGSGARLAENVLSRSGLALAGANQKNDGQGNDGIFTALEASGLDLHGTKLVVLSACETGGGEVQSGEGVYGLRRALVLAGAESQIISLWKVNDFATRDLMVDFYETLQKGVGRAEALKQVQLSLIRNKEHSHPYFWAAFILSGQWGPL